MLLLVIKATILGVFLLPPFLRNKKTTYIILGSFMTVKFGNFRTFWKGLSIKVFCIISILVVMMGVEPTVENFRDSRFAVKQHHRMERKTGLEPATPDLEGRCSTK